ncbi:hypothetical protein PR048_010456 [Dryococelus australis]|uniref:Uncharacterized protein n=1 Tax=Dryococelus australis TaxID=614101 RepID=A0ABQ9I386_9NEOP|nr:hypothetical protein PR048_010456 [Dryococelus australis]
MNQQPGWKSRGNGRSLRKPADQRHHPVRLLDSKIWERHSRESKPVHLKRRRAANRVQSPAESPDFLKWESCRTITLVGGFPRVSSVFPAPSFRRRSMLISITLIGSEDLDVKSRPNLFTGSCRLCRMSGPITGLRDDCSQFEELRDIERHVCEDGEATNHQSVEWRRECSLRTASIATDPIPHQLGAAAGADSAAPRRNRRPTSPATIVTGITDVLSPARRPAVFAGGRLTECARTKGSVDDDWRLRDDGELGVRGVNGREGVKPTSEAYCPERTSECEVLRADDGANVSMEQRRNKRAGGKRKIPEKSRRPTTSSGTIPTCKNPEVIRPGTEPGPPWWDVSSLTAQPPQRECTWSSRYKWLLLLQRLLAQARFPRGANFPAKMVLFRLAVSVPISCLGRDSRTSHLSSVHVPPVAMFKCPPSALTHSRFHSSVSYPLVHSSHEHLTRRNSAISCRPQFPYSRTLCQAASVKDCRPLGCGSIYSVLGRHLESSPTRVMCRGGPRLQPVSPERSCIVARPIETSSRREGSLRMQGAKQRVDSPTPVHYSRVSQQGGSGGNSGGGEGEVVPPPQRRAAAPGHTARSSDDRWTTAVMDWIPRDLKRSRGSPPDRWDRAIIGVVDEDVLSENSAREDMNDQKYVVTLSPEEWSRVKPEEHMYKCVDKDKPNRRNRAYHIIPPNSDWNDTIN